MKKRYGIYISVILILLLCCHLNGYAQLNASIESITMTYPIEDTIYDPVEESLIVQIELDSYFIWQNTPPDSIGFFSFPGRFNWENTDVTNTTIFIPEYKSVSPLYLFDQEINEVYFWLYDPDNEIDTVSSFSITYNKPQVELLSVSPADQVPGMQSYVVDKSNPILAVHAASLFPSTRADSYITKIQLKDVNSAGYITVWEDAAGMGQVDIEIDLPANVTLEAGIEKDFTLRAIGRTATAYTGPVESSEELNFQLTYMTIDVPDTICQVSSNIILNAYPAGGSFSGKGIIDNTSLFNPAQAEANTHNLITYTNIIQGTEFGVTADIYVIDLPLIELEGEMEVCANSTDVIYKLVNAETDKYDYIWEFTGVAEILDSTDVSRTVRWQADPASYTGRIMISLEGKHETECPATFDYLVDIDPDDAPDKPCICFGDADRHLLLASNTEAVHYNWYILDGVFIGYTSHPYFYLTDAIRVQNNITESTRFEVQIANQLTGCYTTGYMCEEELCNEIPQASLLTKNDSNGLNIGLTGNPVRERLEMSLEGAYTGSLTMKVYSINGTQQMSASLQKKLPSEEYSLNLDPGLSPGVYILVGQYGQNMTAPVKLIVY